MHNLAVHFLHLSAMLRRARLSFMQSSCRYVRAGYARVRVCVLVCVGAGAVAAWQISTVVYRYNDKHLWQLTL